MKKILLLIIFLLTFDLIAEKDPFCPLPANAESRIMAQLTSAIPFKLVSVISSKKGFHFQQTIQLEFDLWDEKVSIKIPNKTEQFYNLKETPQALCNIFSKKNLPKAGSYTFRLLLNPQLDGNLTQFQSIGQDSTKWLHLDWDKLLKESKVKTLIFERSFQL